MTPTDALAAARDALKAALPDTPVLLRGDPDPGNQEPVVVLDLVTSQPYGYDQAQTTEVQVSCYALRVAEALELQETTATAMQAAGFRMGQTRPTTDETGVITDWRM